jgi:hypothetical protein
LDGERFDELINPEEMTKPWRKKLRFAKEK